MPNKVSMTLAAAVLLTCGLTVNGQEVPTEGDANVAAIQAAVQAYVAAFNARDAEKLAALWSPDAVYTSRTTGEQVVGRDAIAQEFQQILGAQDAPKLAVSTETIEFVSPNVALETGSAAVTYAPEDVVDTRYSVVYVRRDGEWLIDRVTEDETTGDDSNRDQLRSLAWLVGEWIDEIDGVTVELDCQWTSNQNYISRKYTVTHDGEVESSGLQIIGWDAANEQIRSWLFDSAGGFVAGTWTQQGDKWIVQSVATLADGAEGSSTSIFRPLEDGNYAWKKVHRVVDGELLPNIDETVVRRQ